MGKGPHLNVDATPLMHRLPAVWRMRARLPQPASLRFIVMLRQPEKRSASHFQMLQKLSRRGEEWARLYVQAQRPREASGHNHSFGHTRNRTVDGP